PESGTSGESPDGTHPDPTPPGAESSIPAGQESSSRREVVALEDEVTEDEAASHELAAQAEHDRAAQELVASGLFAGPDPNVVGDVLASPDVPEVVDPTARA